MSALEHAGVTPLMPASSVKHGRRGMSILEAFRLALQGGHVPAVPFLPRLEPPQRRQRPHRDEHNRHRRRDQPVRRMNVNQRDAVTGGIIVLRTSLATSSNGMCLPGRCGHRLRNSRRNARFSRGNRAG